MIFFRPFRIFMLVISSLILSHILFAAENETQKWAIKCIPLPKQIHVEGSVSLELKDMFFQEPHNNHPVDKTIVSILKSIATGKKGFEIKLVLTSDQKDCPPQIKKSLCQLKNKDQAYVIEPLTKNDQFTGLLLVANTPTGLLYATRTFNQLCAGENPDEKIEIPKVKILDWPDLEERGEWGWNLPHDKFSIAELKMNEIEVHSNLGFNRDGSPFASQDLKFLQEAHQLGTKVVPIIKHLEQLAKTGLFKYHPEVTAVFEPGKELPSDYQPAVCFSQPKSVELISGWMRQLLSYPGVDDINAWLAESDAPCFCENCIGQNSFQMQTKALVEAFEQVQPDFPNSHLRILLSQASYPVNDKVLEVIKPETRITYYSGQKTYDSSRNPMIYPLLDNFTKKGGWLGVYPQLTNSWRSVFPFSGAHFIKARMSEFVNKGLSSLSGYATPSNCYYDFNIAATAEWSWNSNGRTEKEFAKAYATRIGIKNPDLYSQWVDEIGPIGWSIAGSRIVESFIFAAGGQVFIDGFIEDGKLFTEENLTFGKGILSEFRYSEVLDENIAKAKMVLDLAREIDEPVVVLESQSVHGVLQFVKFIKEYYDVFNQPESFKRNSQLKSILQNVDETAKQLTISLHDWALITNPVDRENLHYRVRDSIDFASTIAEMLRSWVVDLQMDDPKSDYRFKKIANWKSDDFKQSSEIEIWADVTGLISSKSEYDIRLFFLEGKSGVYPQAVTLYTGQTKESALPITSDRWESRLSKYGRYIEYWISVPQQPKNITGKLDRYFIKSEISGPSLDLPANRRTTNGEILLRKSWRPGL